MKSLKIIVLLLVVALAATAFAAGHKQGPQVVSRSVALNSVATITTAPLGAQTGRAKTSFDPLGTITIAVSPQHSGPLYLYTLKVTFTGSAPNNANFLSGVSLRDQNFNDVVVVGEATVTDSSPCNGTNSCSATWTFTSPGWIIPEGMDYTFTLAVNDLLTAPPQQGIAQSLFAGVAGFTYKGTTSTDGPVVFNPPLQINSVTFLPGQ